MKIKIFVATPNPRDPNSFWRCLGPLGYLEKESQHEIEISSSDHYPQGVSWNDLMKFDILFLHRPCRTDDLILIQLAKRLNIPVWIDFDDWLFELPSWNPSQGFYNNKGTQNFVAQCIGFSDVISVSTAELYNAIKQINPNTVLIPNAYRSDLFTYRKENLEERLPVAYWRGTNTHDGDLCSVSDGFLGLKGIVHFFGDPTWMLLSRMKPGTFQLMGNLDPFRLTRTLYDIRPKVCLFPIFDCFFNRCKSNIAYIEAIHAGAICIAPDLPEWRREGVITYEPHNADAFRDAANTAFDIPENEHQEIIKKAYKSMRDSYDITVVNQIRKNLVLSMVQPDFKMNPYSPEDQPKGIQFLSQIQGVIKQHG